MMAGVSKRQSHVFDQGSLSVHEHFEQIHDRIDVLLRSSKALLSLVKKRISIEKDRIKTLNKLTSTVLEESKSATFAGVLGESWRQIQLHPQQESLHRSKTLTSIEEEVVQPLSVFLLSDLEKRFHHITQDVRRLMKDYSQQQHHLMKAKDRYFTVCSEWENHLIIMYKEFGAAWEPSVGNKLYEKEQMIYRRVEEARLDYVNYVETVNSMQHDLCDNLLPQSISTILETAEQMVSVVHTALKSFEILQASFIGKTDTPQSLACTEFFIVSEFCKKTILNNVEIKDLPPPQPVEFIEYSYKDAPLEIQAKKTQYRAMSLLSPAELATRGAMFLGESGKTANSIRGTSHHPATEVQKPKLKGLNKDLVEICVEYLNQPLAKKEEGLFRVSGDSSVIKSLHSTFMTPDQDIDLLRSSIKSQMDPNNVSGLLKLHLRENPILSSALIAGIQEEMKSSSPSEIASVVHIIVTECSSLELDLLTKLVQLLKEIVSSPWKEHNKMTPRTLGIACGLSLFPQLDPGQATYLMEYLIKHHEELSSSHSIL